MATKKDDFGFKQMTNEQLAEWVGGAVPFCNSASHNLALKEAAKRLGERRKHISKKEMVAAADSIAGWLPGWARREHQKLVVAIFKEIGFTVEGWE